MVCCGAVNRKQERAMLKLENLSRHFGGIRAVDELNLEVHPGEIWDSLAPTDPVKAPPST